MLDGRTAVVTGATGTIGGQVAAALRQAGADVVVTGSSDRVGATAERIGCVGVRADLATEDGRRRLAAEATEALGQVDILFASHGVATSAPSLDADLDDWRRTLEVNLTATFDLCQHFGRGMVERGWGRIVLVASMYAFFGGVNVAAYTASKGGVAQLTKALANEWAAHGVNVNAIAPGYIRSELNAHVWSDPDRSAEIVGRTPAGRWGEAEDLAGPAVFLASDAAAFVHGVVLPVDGGFSGR